jgi:hypothetical protein
MLTAIALVPAVARGQQEARPRESASSKQAMTALGKRYKTAWDLYQALKTQAHGGAPMTWQKLPDWSGLWTNAPGEGLNFDPDQPPGGLPTAKLTPEAHARMMDLIDKAKKGIEYDPISDCSPPGFPRWLDIPFLREFIVRPEETWLSSETVNNVRRIYTDGRDHIAAADRYPIPYGDSIGFWNGEKLVIHTDQIKGTIYNRAQPEYSDQTETVEIWEKTSPTMIRVQVWVYDPVNLVEPWYVVRHYVKVPNPDKTIRIRYWDCHENPNNDVVQTKNGSSDFVHFTFDENQKPSESEHGN